MSAQMKIMIDRFYARNGSITKKRMKAALLTTARNDDDVVMKGIKTHFDIIFDYLAFRNKGMLFAKGAGTVGMMPKNYLNDKNE
jgi:multimeric flavodoxin WrbA